MNNKYGECYWLAQHDKQVRADALANKVNMIEDSNFNPQMLKSCTDTSYQCGYQQGKSDGAREFAEWVEDKDFEFRCLGCKFKKECESESADSTNMTCVEFILAKWQKEQSNAQNT